MAAKGSVPINHNYRYYLLNVLAEVLLGALSILVPFSWTEDIPLD